MSILSEKEKLKNRPIGFMDSGVGGLSVLREAVRVLPAEDFIYFGDSANAPYGTKTVKRHIGVDIMLSIFSINKWAPIAAVAVAPGIHNIFVVILRSLNVGIIKYVSCAVIGWFRSQKCSCIPYFNRWY